MYLQLMNLDVRSQGASFFVTVRSLPEHKNPPSFYAHATAENFIETVLGMTVDDFAMKFDAFSILGLKGMSP